MASRDPIPAAPGTPAIALRDLVVRYGDRRAVDGIGFEVAAGEVVTLLGPNGAGKTSTVEAIEGYRRRDSGSISVLGLDPRTDHRELVTRVGVMLQRGGIYPMLAPAQVLRLFAGYYRHPVAPEELLDLVALRQAAKTPWRHLSGGEQQRLSLALALIGRPQVVILDEPTAGIDPEGRIAIRSVVASLAERGVAVLLTTHELAEAERMTDRLVVIRSGRTVISGTVDQLARSAGPPEVRFRTGAPIEAVGLSNRLQVGITEIRPGDYRVEGPASPNITAGVASWLSEEGVELLELRTDRSLEDVYLAMVGQGSGPEGSGPEGSGPEGSGPEGASEDASEGATAAGAPGPSTSTLSPAQLDGGRSAAPGPADGSAGSGTDVASFGSVDSPTLRVPPLRPFLSQWRAETWMTLRRGETLLLVLGIPVAFLAFFSSVKVLPTGSETAVGFLVPGILALAVMSTAMVSLGIATGFERGYGVLKRLGATPLGRPRLLGAKVATVVLVELVQAGVLIAVGFGLGWSPGDSAGTVAPGEALAVALLATVAFGGLGLLLAGRLRAEVNLAAANGLYLILLLVGGMLIPLAKLPSGLATVARLLPAAALSDGLHATLGRGTNAPLEAWVVLAVWAVGAPMAAALTFRWE